MAPARAEFHGGDAMGKCEQRRSRTIIIFTRASPVLPPPLSLSLSVSLFVCPPRAIETSRFNYDDFRRGSLFSRSRFVSHVPCFIRALSFFFSSFSLFFSLAIRIMSNVCQAPSAESAQIISFLGFSSRAAYINF